MATEKNRGRTLSLQSKQEICCFTSSFICCRGLFVVITPVRASSVGFWAGKAGLVYIFWVNSESYFCVALKRNKQKQTTPRNKFKKHRITTTKKNPNTKIIYIQIKEFSITIGKLSVIYPR